MTRGAEVPEFPDEVAEGARKGGVSGLKLLLIGALAPVVLAGTVVGGMLAMPSSRDEGSVAGKDDGALDCRSPRHSWRWACQQATSSDGYGISVAAMAEGPVVTGSVERQVTQRSTTARRADGEPMRAADAGAEPAAKPQAGFQKPEAVKPAPAAPSPKTVLAEAVPEKSDRKVVAEAPPSAPKALPAQPKETAAAPALTPMRDDEAPRATAAAAPAVQQSAKTASSAPPASASAAPSAAPAEPKVTPLAATEPAVARAAAGVTAPPATARAPEAASRKAAAVSDDEDEPAPRLSRKLVKAREAAAAKPKVASRPAHPARTARVKARDNGATAGGYKVMSVRAYTLPDGRRVMVQSVPRPEVVQELLAEHRATFGRQQFATPYSRW
jgi:hypothetical protein